MGGRSRRRDLARHVQRVRGQEPAGGSVQLGELIEEHGQALLYDLAALGVDLRDLWRPGSTVTPRYVLWLVGQLPPDSALGAAHQGGPEFRSWTPQNYLLAAAVNLLAAANRQRAGKRSSKPLVTPPRRKQKARVIPLDQIARRQREQGMFRAAAEQSTQEPNTDS
ncbi:MAG TPA: hypothetical protein VF174_09595 [Micromonosporaceae bacterium]